MKNFLLIVAAIITTLLTGCDNNATNHQNETATDSSAMHHNGEAHIYSCPMHPEVTSDKPGKCPKCGMDLVHTDHAANGKKYRIDFNYTPAKLEAGKVGLLHFMPVEVGNEKAPVPLDMVHDKKMHLIIVSKDLSYFDHVHPEYTADGHMTVDVIPTSQAYKNGIGNNETKFPYGGDFILFQDYSPTGASHQLSRIPIHVEGTEKKAVTYTKENLTWSKDSYKVTLAFDKNPVKANDAVMLTAHITKDGNHVNDLDNYLGALGHMVVISEDTEHYLHVHPMDSDTKGPDIMFHSNFEKAGIYRGFLQFKHKGVLHTADFVLNIQ